MTDKILEIKDLKVSFDTYAGEIQAVRGVTFEVNNGEVLAIVGESGCGKSVTAQTIMKLNPMPPARIKSGEIILDGIDIVSKTEKEMENIRGELVSMIFQDPMSSLNPTMQIGKQLTESIVKHDKDACKAAKKPAKAAKKAALKEAAKLDNAEEKKAAIIAAKEEYKKATKKITKEEATKEAIRLLELVQIPNPDQRIKQYPHEFSGGMRQRVMIAMGLSCNPKLLIADEPTTALDVTIQAQIMDLMADLKNKLGTSIILITHDLGVVANLADRVAVMYAGKIVETGKVDDIFYNPSHPYTNGLLDSLPRIDSNKDQDLMAIEGTPPDLFAPPKGCEFAARCKHCMNICVDNVPPLYTISEGHEAACWLHHKDCKTKIEKGGENNAK